MEFDLPAIVWVEQHSITGDNGPHQRADSDSCSPGQTAPDRGCRRDHNSGCRSSFALRTLQTYENTVVEKPDWQAIVGICFVRKMVSRRNGHMLTLPR